MYNYMRIKNTFRFDGETGMSLHTETWPTLEGYHSVASPNFGRNGSVTSYDALHVIRVLRTEIEILGCAVKCDLILKFQVCFIFS